MYCWGDYFCADSPAALQNHFLRDLNISETKFMTFFSNIQWASIVSGIFGGFLIDRIFGNRVGMTLFSGLTTCAHAMFSGGAISNSYWMMFVARAIYGLVNGPMSIANQNMAVKWFKTSNINFAFGLKTSIARTSSVVVINVMDTIYDYFGKRSHGHVCLGITLFTDVVVRVSDIKDFPATFWLISMTTACYYSALFPFVGLGQVFYEMKYDREPQVADNVNSMVYLMAAITTPVFGLLIDKLGRSLFWMFAGIILSTGSHFILAFTFIEPYIATVAMGLGFSIFTAAMLPMVSFIIAFNRLGTAYGIMNAMIAVCQAGTAYFAGYLADNNGYLVLEVFFTACMAGSLILGSLLYITDQAKGGEVNLSSTERRNRANLKQEGKELGRVGVE
ncbi:major facilitator superfamily domain-containing protein 1-like isoform X2 [Mercenaria mercenaria]|uniref:major facilitator superfamily domain-containing protein 1-like isoform X2 n=1 Tax=Mercenaria mercenaria TaxID=6596 RepID=UPI00234E5DF5|nr:major facilitator superfamily domain-containing protein 1-like isoform X2 [Mercenaria mercenaria]